ncbi:MAG TPA: hypothetical protein DER26_05205 [Verrucomicrobia bacterium]|nr:hypothetical protein [Verrucomicrobiota bacterium]
MKKKNILLLVGTALLLVAGAYFARRAAHPAAPALAGKALSPAFDVADVARVEIGTNLVLAAGDTGWTISSLYGYPAERAKLVDNLLKLRDLRVGQVVRGRKIAAPMEVFLKNADGETLASFVLGESHFRKPSGQAALYGGAYPDGRYLAFRGETVLVNDALEAFDGTPGKWCSTRIAAIPAADVEEVSFAQGTNVFALAKDTNGVWRAEGLAADEELDSTKTWSLDSALSYLDFSSVVDPGTSPDVLGFATGAVCTVALKGGTNHVARVGNAVKGGTDRYFKLDDGPWTYTISSYAAEALTKTRKDFVKPKENPAKGAPSGEAGEAVP